MTWNNLTNVLKKFDKYQLLNLNDEYYKKKNKKNQNIYLKKLKTKYGNSNLVHTS
jgi:hypothetical protein